MKTFSFFLSMLFCGILSAKDIRIVGSFTKELYSHQTKKVSRDFTVGESHPAKKIKLLKVELSAKARQVLQEKAEQALNHQGFFSLNQASHGSRYPKKIALGMNEVPVFDQGMYATCTTLAVTAALDAALEKGDYISHLCQLALQQYLSNTSYLSSGWDGATAREILSLIDIFGIVNKAREELCIDLSMAGTSDEAAEVRQIEVNFEKYHDLSENLASFDTEWSSILDSNQALSSEHLDTNRTLNDVKAALASGDRLVISSFLWSPDQGLMGALGSNKASLDSWILTTSLARNVYLEPLNFGIHAMIVTGYDDKASVVDEDGNQHQGLLTLRNSWGERAGDLGDFYMSYDYFKLFVVEVQRIRS